MSQDEWRAALDDLARRRETAREMGGGERLARHHASGKLDARGRIERLLDPATFSEIGTLVGDVPADAIVVGAGRIDGRPVMVGAEDFTVLAGTIAGGSNAKRYRIAELAVREQVPLIMLLEGAGYRADDRAAGRGPTDLIMQAQCSGRVPLVTGILGPSAGHGALIAGISDFAVMTEQGAVFTAGPPVVKESIGEDVSKEALGGPGVALASGLVHNLASDDGAALDQIRDYLSYFPSNAWQGPPRREGGDAGPRAIPGVLDIVPRDNRRVYDMRAVVDLIVDDGEWTEIGAGFGPAIICALAHLGGESVAIVANQPLILAGSIDCAAADKAAHFIGVADAFHVPLVFLADNPGMLPGTASERAGILRSGARMFVAQTTATTVKLHVTLRKAYGFGSMVMAMIAHDGQSATFAWPGATLGAMGAGASSRAIGASADLAEQLHRAELDASYRSAKGLGFDEMIDPRETRNALIEALRRRPRRTPGPRTQVAITP